MKLTIEDLREVRRLLYPARRKWYHIGVELNLKIEELDTIKARCNSDPNECLIEMLKVWLKSTDSSPTWKALGDALKAEPVDEVKLAQKAYSNDGSSLLSAADTVSINREQSQSAPQTDQGTQTSANQSQQEEEMVASLESRSRDSTDGPEERFPLLNIDVSVLHEGAKDELLTRLNAETKTICLSFGSLVARTELCLQKSEITNENLKTFFEHCEMDELANSIDSTDTIPMILRKVKKGGYWSFFNYELLEDIIDTYCQKTTVIADLERYISKFNVYCQRRVSEVPGRALKSEHIEPQSTSLFKVKMDDKFSIHQSNLALIKHIQQMMSKILNKRPILLTDIQDGCIKLTFRHFKVVFPLSKEEKLHLAEIGVKWLHCGKYKVWLKDEAGSQYKHSPFNVKLEDKTVIDPGLLQNNMLSDTYDINFSRIPNALHAGKRFGSTSFSSVPTSHQLQQQYYSTSLPFGMGPNPNEGASSSREMSTVSKSLQSKFSSSHMKHIPSPFAVPQNFELGSGFGSFPPAPLQVGLPRIPSPSAVREIFKPDSGFGSSPPAPPTAVREITEPDSGFVSSPPASPTAVQVFIEPDSGFGSSPPAPMQVGLPHIPSPSAVPNSFKPDSSSSSTSILQVDPEMFEKITLQQQESFNNNLKPFVCKYPGCKDNFTKGLMHHIRQHEMETMDLCTSNDEDLGSINAQSSPTSRAAFPN